MHKIKYGAAFLVLILLIAAGAWFYYHKIVLLPHPSVIAVTACQVVKAGPHDRKKLALPDGSIITLFPNTGLKISCHFTDSARIVSLDGEAFFEVKPGPAKPFLVISKDL